MIDIEGQRVIQHMDMAWKSDMASKLDMIFLGLMKCGLGLDEGPTTLEL